MEEQRGLVQQPLGRAGVLDDDRLGEALQLRLFASRQLLARVDDHRDRRVPLVLLQPLEQVEARHLRELEVEHHAVEALALERLERFLARANRGHVDIVAGTHELDD